MSIQSDYNVCSECGSLQECPHDRDGGTSDTIVRIPLDEHDLYYEMISNTAIPPHTEIFNTYGEDLTNAQLLNQYGFILDVNENDRLFWTMDDVLETLAFGHTTGGIHDSHRQRLAQDLRDVSAYILGGELVFRQSHLLYHEASRENVFCLNSDGIMSHHLWLALFVLSVWRNFPSNERLEPDVAQMAHSILELQAELELEILEDEEEDMDDDDDDRQDRKPIGKVPSDLRIPALLHDITRFAVQLCITRKATSGPEGFSAEQLSDIIDAEVSAIASFLIASVYESVQLINFTPPTCVRPLPFPP